MKTRINFLDNLRTFMIFLVVVLHAGLVYEVVLENQWIVVDESKNNSIGLIRMYLDLFIMFIMFFIAGYFIPISLRKNNNRDYLLSKFKRIMIPWLIGVLTLIPAYKVIFLYSRGLPQEEWFSYFHFFQRAGTDLSFYGNSPLQSWLWFLPVLFLFQLVYLVMAKLKVFRINLSLGTAVGIMFIVGLVYSMIISIAELRGWYHATLLHFQRERLLVYFMAFLLGSLSYKLKVFETHTKNTKLYIVANIVLTISLTVFTAVALNLFYNNITPGRNYYFVSDFFDRLLYYTSALWSMLSFLYVFIHVFRFYVNKSGRLLQQLNKSSYSVYMIHMIVMGLIAMPMTQVSMPVMLKYLILVISTFGISSLLVYVYQQSLRNKPVIKMAMASLFLLGFFLMTLPGNRDGLVKHSEPQLLSQSIKQLPQPGLHEAVIQGNLAVVKEHIGAGSDLDIKDPSGGSSPLITAAAFGKVEIAKALIEAGANVDFRNNEGSTPLHTAAFFCQLEIVEALLAKGADKSIRNNSGSTAMESVLVPFEAVSGVYDYFNKTFGPMGMVLDYEMIQATRPEIAELLK